MATQGRITVLGRITLQDQNGHTLLANSQSIAIAAVLASQPDGRAQRSNLAELFWPRENPSIARQRLRQAIYYLARNGGPGILITDGKWIRFAFDHCALDLHEFDRAISIRDYSRAIDLAPGRVLAGYDPGQSEELRYWVEAQNQRVVTGLRVAYSDGVEEALELGIPTEAVELGRRWVAKMPLDERARSALVRSLRAIGDEAGAMQTFEEFRVLLRDQLDDLPSTELEELMEPVEKALWEVREANHDARPVAGGVTPPSEIALPQRSNPGRSLAGPLGIAAAVAAIVAALAFAGLEHDRFRVLVMVRGEGGQAGELVIGGREITFEPLTVVGRNALPSPDRGRYASSFYDQAGVDLAIHEASGERIGFLNDAADEHALAWSPDGRRLLVHEGRMSADSPMRYDAWVSIWELDRPDVRFDLAFRGQEVYAAWSPDGTKIVTAEPHGPIRVLDPTGGVLDEWDVARDGSRIVCVAWGPSSSRVLIVSSDGRHSVIQVLWLNDRAIRPVVGFPGYSRGAVWIANRFAIAATSYDGPDNLVLVDLESRRLAELPGQTTVDRVLGAVSPVVEGTEDVSDSLEKLMRRYAGSVGSLVDSLVIDSAEGVVSPGEYVIRSVRPIDERGATLSAVTLGLRWSADGQVLESLGGGRFRALREGLGWIRVEQPGWRSTTEDIRVVLPGRRELPPVLTEEWAQGLDHRWHSYGEPAPVVVSGAGPDGGNAFLSNGDQNYASWVVTKQTFDQSRGLTAEVWIRAPFTGAHFQDWIVAFTIGHGTNPATSGLSHGAAYVHGSGVEASIVGGLLPVGMTVPLPVGHHGWQRYALQLSPTGTLALLHDGRVYARGAIDTSKLGERVHLLIGGASLGAQILHGPITVYEGELYQIR